MSAFRRGGGRKRRDANEPAIIETLRACGWYVKQVSGDGLPDLICAKAGKFVALEVKTKTGTLRESQKDTPWLVVRTPEEAMQAVNR